MVNTLPSNAGGVGSVPGWGTKIPHTVGCGQKLKKKKKIRCYSVLSFSSALLLVYGRLDIDTQILLVVLR